MQTVTPEEITRQVWTKIDALPQRGAILESDARAWVDDVVGRYGELANWHAARAGGFGGSQIGGLVKNFQGERADHDQTAHDIVAGALLRKVPDTPNGHMLRGIAMEPQHRRWFHEKYGSTRDMAGFTTLSKSVGSRQWMRYSPDDLAFVQVEAGSTPERTLIDYKAPNQADGKDGVAFQYSCQLHMGRLVCEHNGITIDRMMLSQFDWSNWALKDDLVPHVPELDDLIIKAGDHYWAFVLRGEVPPYVRKSRLDKEESLRESLNAAAMNLARLKCMGAVIDKHVEAYEEQIKPVLKKFHFGRDKLVLNGISYTASPKFESEAVAKALPEGVFEALPLKGNSTKAYDEKAMVKKLKELAVDVNQFAKPGSVDPDALYDALIANGADADSLMAESLTGRVDTKLKADVEAWFEREFQEYLPGKAEVVVASTPSEGVDTPDGREGQEMLRYVPRPVSE